MNSTQTDLYNRVRDALDAINTRAQVARVGMTDKRALEDLELIENLSASARNDIFAMLVADTHSGRAMVESGAFA